MSRGRGLGETVAEIGIAEFTDGLEPGLFAVGADGGQGHAVEGACFDHGVVRHVEKDEPLPNLQGFPESIIAHHVAREAGESPEAVAVWEIRPFSGSQDGGAIGHFQDVGHVAGRGGVEDGKLPVTALMNVEHG